jgi:hypothetical protein
MRKNYWLNHCRNCPFNVENLDEFLLLILLLLGFGGVGV